MSYLKTEDLQTPFTEITYAKVIGNINKKSHSQLVAADATADFIWVADFDGKIGDAYVQLTAATAAGESCTYDLVKNGTTIMTGVVSIAAGTAAKTQKDMYASIDPALNFFVKGDVIAVTRDYTAGGGPTPMARNTVYIEPTVKSWK